MRLVIELILGPGHLGEEDKLFSPKGLGVAQTSEIEKQTAKRGVFRNFGLRVPHGAGGEGFLPVEEARNSIRVGWGSVGEASLQPTSYSRGRRIGKDQRRRPLSDRSYLIRIWVGQRRRPLSADPRLLEPGWRILLGPAGAWRGIRGVGLRGRAFATRTTEGEGKKQDLPGPEC